MFCSLPDWMVLQKEGGMTMTIEELKKIPFHFVSHLSMEDNEIIKQQKQL